ncbi:hypothetical protein Tco_0500061 [Tanacetum coccineum]
MFYKKNVDFVELLWEDFTFQIENRDNKKQEKMYYPKFTKAIIHHFITKDKSISMRNRMFMHTARDDSILGTMRFVSKFEDFQIYEAVLPNRMTNQQIQDSDTYKTYLAYVTGATSPKMKRKLKKPASPLKKRTLVTVEEEEPEPAKKYKPTKKPATKRYENKSWGYSGDEANEQEEETQDDEYAHTSEDYVPTDDETNDESDDVTEEEYERINEGLYGDVNVSLTDVEPADKEKDDEEMTVAGHVSVNQEGAGNQVKDDAQATQKTEVDIEVVSMLDINVQHKVSRTSPLLTIPVSVIPEHNVANPPEIVTTASSTTISSLLSSLFPHLQQLTPIPTPTTTEATTSTTVVSESETLAALRLRVTDLEKDVKELKNVDNPAKVISTIQSEVPKAVKEYLGSSLDNAMHKVIQKNIADIIKEHSVPAETVERLRQQYAPQKSVEDIREIKMDHARKQQVPKETTTSSDTTILAEFD